MKAATQLAAALLGALGLALSAAAQQYPTKAVTVVVPLTPGGSSDITARTVSAKLQDALGQSFVIDNKPGANGGLGGKYVANAAAAIAAVFQRFRPRCACSIAVRASTILCRRCGASFWRQRRNKSRMLGGVERGNTFQSGSRSKIAAIVSEMVPRANGDRPTHISYNTHPNAHTSVRLSTISPRACSGLM